MYEQQVSTGELLDRVTILQIKIRKLPHPAAIIAARSMSRLIKQLACKQFEHNDSVRAACIELRQVHLKLWEAEDRIREAAAGLSPDGLNELDMDKWLEAADDRNPNNQAYVLLKHYLRASQDIRQGNTQRHGLVREIDRLVGDVPEPKSYFERPRDDTVPKSA